jgi:hypothetical protein
VQNAIHRPQGVTSKAERHATVNERVGPVGREHGRVAVQRRRGYDDPVDHLPVVSGAADADYLNEAFARAGRRSEVAGPIACEELHGGRCSTQVVALRCGDGQRFVLKMFPERDWRAGLVDHNVECSLWACGTTSGLPRPLSCPTFDVANHEGRAQYWMLMDDVSPGITPRGAFDAAKFRWLLDALAGLHVRYWNDDAALEGTPALSLEQNVSLFAEPVIALAGRTAATGWVLSVIENFVVMRPLLPVFLDALGSRDADFYLDLCQHRSTWVQALAGLPQTLVHGDPRRANVSLLAPGHVSMFDWDLATRGPAALDLAWSWFLQFYCYPPDDGCSLVDREPLRAYYIERLAQALGGRFDRTGFERAWHLSWLKTYIQIGFCLVDPLTGKVTEEEAERVRRKCRESIDHIKWICDAMLR